MLFSGRDASNLYGLWVSDGTAAGTTELQVADANSSSGDGLSPTSFAVADLQATTSRPVPHDVNGDGRADIVWQNQNGAPSVWAMQGGGDTVGAYLDYANPGPSWRLVGSADLNGDGRADLLWQNSQTGAVSAWMMALGGTGVAAYVNFQNPGTSSHLIGGGDLNGDGKADLVFQDDSGTVSAWLMGGSVGNPSVSTYAGFSPISNPGPSWRLKGATDANGDGRADLVWQNDSGLSSLWIMGAGGTSVDSYPVFANPGASWHVV